MKNPYAALKHYIDVNLPPELSGNADSVTIFIAALDLAYLHPEWAMVMRQELQEQLMGISEIPVVVRASIAAFIENHPIESQPVCEVIEN